MPPGGGSAKGVERVVTCLCHLPDERRVGGNEVRNVDLTHRILELVGRPTSLIRPVADRLGHDRRYAVDTTKLRALGWTPAVPFEQGLADTVAWYRENEWWWRPIKERDEAFRAYYQSQYGTRT